MAQPTFDSPPEGDRRPSTAQPVLTPEEARQGVISGRVTLILVTSLVLALIAFVIVYSAEIV
jgi:hypothetical protein